MILMPCATTPGVTRAHSLRPDFAPVTRGSTSDEKHLVCEEQSSKRAPSGEEGMNSGLQAAPPPVMSAKTALTWQASYPCV